MLAALAARMLTPFPLLRSQVMPVRSYLSLAQDGATFVAAAQGGVIPFDMPEVSQGSADAARAYIDRLTSIVKGAMEASVVTNSCVSAVACEQRAANSKWARPACIGP